MPYTLMTAAQACGINRSTVLRAIKSGKISATKDELTGAAASSRRRLRRVAAGGPIAQSVSGGATGPPRPRRRRLGAKTRAGNVSIGGEQAAPGTTVGGPITLPSATGAAAPAPRLGG